MFCLLVYWGPSSGLQSQRHKGREASKLITLACQTTSWENTSTYTWIIERKGFQASKRTLCPKMKGSKSCTIILPVKYEYYIIILYIIEI